MRRYELKKFVPMVLLLIGLGITLYALPKAVRILSKAGGEKAEIVVDLEAIIGPMPRPWRNLAQGGEETGNMLSNVVEEVKALSPEYIRLDHIYDMYGVVGWEAGGLRYNWNELDEAVRSILETGAKPFMVLSYMPLAISRGDIIDQPKDWNDWEELVKATVEHYSGREGLNIDGIYYEVWNEPDLFGGWKVYGEKNYLDLYAATARGVARAKNVNDFKLGGAGNYGFVQKLGRSVS